MVVEGHPLLSAGMATRLSLRFNSDGNDYPFIRERGKSCLILGGEGGEPGFGNRNVPRGTFLTPAPSAKVKMFHVEHSYFKSGLKFDLTKKCC